MSALIHAKGACDAADGKYVLIIAADGMETKLLHKPGYEELQSTVSGGRANQLIERTKVRYMGKRCDCIVNEEGVLHGFELNRKATALYQADWRIEYPYAEWPRAALFGVAVVFVGWRFS